jgi:hypothetical protein
MACSSSITRMWSFLSIRVSGYQYRAGVSALQCNVLVKTVGRRRISGAAARVLPRSQVESGRRLL